MIKRDDLIRYLDDYLKVGEVEDYGPQGLQVEGKEDVETVVTGVSACRKLFEEAAVRSADMVIVHHGLFWEGESRVIKGLLKERLKILIENNITLLAYHLPLDKHPKVGNNAVAARMLGLKKTAEFAEIGLRGEVEEIGIDDLVKKAEEIFGSSPLVFREGPETVRRLAVCSGSAPKKIGEAIELGLDAYLTGEVNEPVMNLAREGKINFIAAGHYATERLGIRALGDLIRNRFDIEVEFVDVPNPI